MNNKAFSYLSFVTGPLFIIIGFAIMYNPPKALEGFPPFLKYVLGFLVVVYGLFRIYRAYKALNAKK